MNNLKLKAEDSEDITIMSAYLQDAITMMGDIAYQRDGRRFVMMLNRYIWENRCPDTGKVLGDRKTACSRIRTGLSFDGVLNIRSQNINKSLKEHPLELLSVEVEPAKDDIFQVYFIFSGDGVIRLDCEMICAHMQDIGRPWPAKCHPIHEILAKHEILEALQDEEFQ